METFKVYKTGNVLHVIGNDTDVDIEANVFDPNVVISKKLKDDTDYYFHGVDTFNSNNKISLADIQKEDGSPYTYEEFELFKNTLNTSAEFEGLTDSQLRANPIHVIVDNQINLADITDELQSIISVLESIEEETQPIEAKLTDIINAITSASTINHADLLAIIDDVDGLESDTLDIRNKLQSIITNTSLSATEVTLSALNARYKLRGSSMGGMDAGLMALGIQDDADARSSLSDGQYGNFSLTPFKEIRTRDQRAIDLQNCNDFTQVTILGNDTANLANSGAHVFGTGAITFDKVNGSDNTIFAGVYSNISPSLNVAEIFESGGFVGLGCYLPSITNVAGVSLRIGTDSSNYNAWFWAADSLTAATWLNLRTPAAIPDFARSVGNGWNTNAISYVAFGVEFSSESSTLAGIRFDHVHIVGGRVTSTDITPAQSTSNVGNNVNVQKIGNSVVDKGEGVVSSGTQRVVDANLKSKIGSTPALSNVAASVTSVTLSVANTNLISRNIYNDSPSIMYMKYGTGASATSFTQKLFADESWTIDDYNGVVTAIWVTATGAARVTEITQ